ncbi:MAG: bacillithiol biosynthesis cysteine-adding enzyme BshC [Flavobacteriaceae bacterium]|nr:bacillithiol biosynthesis cysteine-adding enzyme BshC [Flavobacteriaceae bacterium]|tara:strand:- start:23135 stop:24730 length:1596 start_codon:yes stop_codon:yes gene_type:complete
MPKQYISYSKTGYFSKLICDYLAQKEELNAFYHRFPNLENFKPQLEEKQLSVRAQSRTTLVHQLKKQYECCTPSEATLQNIEALQNDTTFTITTGHQLNLFTGPLYFLYKIFDTINLSEQLNASYPKHHFVPVYWMATEDHDFDEINYFNFKGKKIAWDRNSGGAVGELSTEGLQEVYELLKKEWGGSKNAQELLKLFSESYVKHNNLADATRNLANELFKDYGLVIIDGNDVELKKAFIPYAEKELTEHLSFKKVTETTEKLIETGFGEQVHPREINLFYLQEGLRERIIEKDGMFYVNDTEIAFSKEEILTELQNNPERFSPNALLRPLYQEVILPNLCYIGGGGELAYWFQLKDYFEAVTVPFPVLLLRNSALLVPEKLSEKLDKLEVPISEVFQKQHELKTWYTKKLSEIEIDFSSQREHLQQQFKDLYELAKKTDASFVGAVAAQEKKQLNGLYNLEKRLLKAQKRKLADHLERLTAMQDELFPKGSLQERNENFSEMYLELGDALLSILKKELEPLVNEFTVLKV